MSGMSDTTHRAKTTAASTPGSFAPHTRSESEAGLALPLAFTPENVAAEHTRLLASSVPDTFVADLGDMIAHNPDFYGDTEATDIAPAVWEAYRAAPAPDELGAARYSDRLDWARHGRPGVLTDATGRTDYRAYDAIEAICAEAMRRPTSAEVWRRAQKGPAVVAAEGEADWYAGAQRADFPLESPRTPSA